MDTQAVAKILDEVIAETGEEEFERLSQGMGPSEWAHEVERALRELEKLPRGEMPRYDDEWVALFYLLWYQPKHIALAYSMIQELLRKRPDGRLVLDGKKKLHVIDFGSGTLAMQFAVALATADAIEQGFNVTSVRIDSVDSSTEMVKLGELCWRKFQQRVSIADNPYLAIAFLIISAENPTVTESNAALDILQPDADCWLSAIHAVYKSNRSEVSRALRNLENVHKPIVGFVSSHVSRAPLVHEVSPFGLEPQFSITNAFENGELTKITGYRKRLYEEIRQSPNSLDYYALDFVRRFLTNSVVWQWEAAAVAIYPGE